MSFNSLSFLIFLPTVFFLYWFVFKTKKLQNLLLLVCSYFFYGFWNWRFLILIAISSFLAYTMGLLDGYSREKQTKYWSPKASMILSVACNLGILMVFKYYNFFYDQFVQLFQLANISLPPSAIKLLLPVGISFYTFQALSYNIDIYRGKIKPEKDMIAFFTFISFFPQLVAGPIERASNLLPQFTRDRSFSYAEAGDGCRQILWGFFKKCVVADNCAIIANAALENASSPLAVWLGIFCFSLQIYGDFSGYSDIAIGASRLFGIRLLKNFSFPYFSRNIGEFWRRWHISLNTWFKDYVYIPLGGSKEGVGKQIRNTYIIFLLSGLWHGANWTFVVWGVIHASCFLPLLLTRSNRKYLDCPGGSLLVPPWREAAAMTGTFLTVMLCWVFFRAESLQQAFHYLNTMFFGWGDLNSGLEFLKSCKQELRRFPVFFAVLFAVEWLNRNCEHGLERLPQNIVLRCLIYWGLALCCMFMRGESQTFIYFQF